MEQNKINLIFFTIFSVILFCESKREIQPQTVSVSELFKTDFCAFLEDFKSIKLQIIPWATDKTDPYSESFIFPDENRITFKQDNKNPEAQTQGFRHCFVNNEKFIAKQIVIDSLSDFKFENISIDYGQKAENIYSKNEFIMFLNQPID